MNAQKVTEHIINWLKTYAENAGVKGFVIGVSGGIDSALLLPYVQQRVFLPYV